MADQRRSDAPPGYNGYGARNHHSDDDMETPTSASRAPLLSVSSRVRSIIEDGRESTSGPPTLTNRTLFTQLDVLSEKNGQIGWKQMARWLKYQETVENAGRWSKPHVPTGSMHALNEFRKVLSDGTCALGLGLKEEGSNPTFIAEAVAETLRNNPKSNVSEREARLIIDTILKPHKHMNRKASGKSVSSEDGTGQSGGYQSADDRADNNNDGDKHKRKFLRRRSGDGRDVAVPYHKFPPGTRPDNLKPYKPNKHLGKKLPKDCEAANILVGQVNFLRETVVALCRFDPPRQMADLTEVDLGTRFIFVVLGPVNTSCVWDLTELGRAMGTLLNDKVFCEVAYHAKNAQDLLDGLDEYIDDLTVLPPSIWDYNTRLEPPSQTRSLDKIALRLDDAERIKGRPTEGEQESGASEDVSLIRTGRLFGGMIYDMKARYKYYLSDFKDGIHSQCLASAVFLFFACISPIVTFGGLMGQATDGYMGTIEMLLSGAICGIIYAFFSGQPLTIIGATGPLLVFESILYIICKENGITFLSLRFWVGAWVTLILFLCVAFDVSALVRYITRFTEESFSILISVIFVYEACNKVIDIFHNQPVHTGVIRPIDDNLTCFCNLPDWVPVGNGSYFNTTLNATVNTTIEYVQSNWTSAYREECITIERRLVVTPECITLKNCTESGGNLTGTACDRHYITDSVPDVFFFSVILALGTYSLAMAYRNFRTSPYFPTIIRSTVADFAVFMSIVTWTAVDYFFGLDTPKLNVPKEFVPTRSDRNWLINPFDIEHIWLIPAALLPAILATILIFLDQQITAVIVNRKEHKLKKPHGYHLDLAVLTILILICSFLGLPWFVAATVRSLTHVKSLIRISEISIPGERSQMLGCREQRLTGVVIHVLIGLSTLLTGILRVVPMPVLYGVFLYMGLTSLGDVQFIDRIAIVFMPAKYQPDYVYLRHVRTFRVHLFTLIQVLCFVGMWAIKSIKVTALGFPVMLLVLVIVRKLMDFVFTQTELYWLDHLLPEELRRQEDDRKRALGDISDGVFDEKPNKGPIYRKKDPEALEKA